MWLPPHTQICEHRNLLLRCVPPAEIRPNLLTSTNSPFSPSTAAPTSGLAMLKFEGGLRESRREVHDFLAKMIRIEVAHFWQFPPHCLQLHQIARKVSILYFAALSLKTWRLHIAPSEALLVRKGCTAGLGRPLCSDSIA